MLRARTRRATITAPLQVIALSFTRDAGSEDRILAEVDRLRGRGVLRLLDMLFVAKSQDGTIERLTIGEDEDFGSLLAVVVPVANGGRPAVPVPADGSAAFDRADARALADSRARDRPGLPARRAPLGRPAFRRDRRYTM